MKKNKRSRAPHSRQRSSPDATFLGKGPARQLGILKCLPVARFHGAVCVRGESRVGPAEPSRFSTQSAPSGLSGY